MKPNLARLEELRKSDPVRAEKLERALARVRETREQNPLWFYRPHAKQQLFHAARAPRDDTLVAAFIGGNQSGKSLGGACDDLIQAVDEDVLPDHLKPFKRFQPPFKCRIFAPDFTNTMQEGVMAKLRDWVPRGQLLGGSWEKAYDKQNRKLRFANGSYFDFLSYEQDLDKMGTVTIDRVHFDEEPPGEKGRKMYQQARMRVMVRGGDILITMTPELGMSWVMDEVWERRDDPDVVAIQVDTDDNPTIPRAQLEAAFSRMTDEEQRAKRHGQFVAFGGLVLGLEEHHKVQAPKPKHVQALEDVFVILDPGAAQGAVLWGGFDRDDTLLAFDELYPSGALENQPANLALQIREKNAFWGVDPYYVIDPSARNRTVDGGEGVEAAWWEQDIYPVYAKNDRFMSIMQLRRRRDAKPQAIFVSRECPKLLWELGRWRVAEDEHTSEDKIKRGNTGDSFATTGPDHLGDCLRYLAMQRIFGPAHQKPAGQQGWVPGTAPNQDWFSQHRSEQFGPMGAYS